MNKATYYRAVVRSESLIRAYFTRHSSDPDERSDLTQETIAALLDAANRFRGDCKFSTWVYSVCRNVYRKHVHSQARTRRIGAAAERELANLDEHDSRATDRAQIRGIIETLELADRRLYRLFYVEHRSVADVASLLDGTAGTTKWLLHRLRGRVRDAILRMGYEDSSGSPAASVAGASLAGCSGASGRKSSSGGHSSGLSTL